ncbi:MAG TPA: hypothetical protein VL426_05810 [Candidatus Binatia bacterium]|jgi:hypothetical protein|nr:hypothetical protein [Candidatus Binatia bacterium]
MSLLNLVVSLLVIGFPRGFAALLWSSTGWFDGAFATRWLPAMGLALMPYSLLWFSAVHNILGGAWGGFQTAVMAMAVLADISCWAWLGESRD